MQNPDLSKVTITDRLGIVYPAYKADFSDMWKPSLEGHKIAQEHGRFFSIWFPTKSREGFKIPAQVTVGETVSAADLEIALKVMQNHIEKLKAMGFHDRRYGRADPPMDMPITSKIDPDSVAAIKLTIDHDPKS